MMMRCLCCRRLRRQWREVVVVVLLLLLLLLPLRTLRYRGQGVFDCIAFGSKRQLQRQFIACEPIP